MARIWEERVFGREKSSKARRLHVLMKEQNKISVAGKEKEGKEEEGSRYGRQQPQRSDPRGLEGSWDFFQRS